VFTLKRRRSQSFTGTIPNFNDLLAAENVWDIIQWHQQEFVADCDRTRITIGEERDAWIGPAQRGFMLRSQARLLAQINAASLLHGLLKRIHQNAVTQLEEFYGQRPRRGTSLRSADRHMTDVIKWRNKLAAHSVYANPRVTGALRNRDNDADSATSIGLLKSGGFVPMQDNLGSWRLGGMRMRVGRTQTKHFNGTISPSEVFDSIQ
jgi:hypothetical protein